jgi:phage portal protein BeeE
VATIITFGHQLTLAASIGLQLRKGDKEDLVDKHPVLDLLDQPNPVSSGSDFIYGLIAWRLIGGEAFIVKMPWGTGKPATTKLNELWLLEPHRVKVNHDMFGMPVSYEYQPHGGGEKLVFPVDRVKGTCDVLHLRQFNPLNLTRGLSPMSAAAYAIDTHNAALRWNAGPAPI